MLRVMVSRLMNGRKRCFVRFMKEKRRWLIEVDVKVLYCFLIRDSVSFGIKFNIG